MYYILNVSLNNFYSEFSYTFIIFFRYQDWGKLLPNSGYIYIYIYICGLMGTKTTQRELKIKVI